MFHYLDGLWHADTGDGATYEITLPGTLDENRIGKKDIPSAKVHPDAALGSNATAPDPDSPIATRFTRKYTFEGEVHFTRRIGFRPPEGKRVFLEVERARCLRLLADGTEVPHFAPPSLSTPQVFEVTGLLNGDNTLVLISDNSYPGLPHDAITMSSAATDETQTNWNGILGNFRLRMEESMFFSAVRVYPKGGTLTVIAEISAAEPWSGTVFIASVALAGPASQQVSLLAGASEVTFGPLPLADNIRRWDEFEGHLYELTASLSGAPAASRTVRFGVRSFGGGGGGKLALNGRTLFLRSEVNCAVFPETGYAPMDTESWSRILHTYKSYGVNCVRFHSWCPPQAAFTAADEMGMLMQPELSCWNPVDAFESDESFAYYQAELEQILRTLANHPSFVMLTFGNELKTHELGYARMDEMLAQAQALDGTRLFANGSNVHYGERGCDAASDFYTSFTWYEHPLRGTFAGMKGYINHQYPSAMTHFDASMKHLQETYKKPVFSFEVGQFEVLPDFAEITEFNGVTVPANLELIRQRVEERGLSAIWPQYVQATGALSRICYREEIEAAMRSEKLSGISLLGLQDFPGQGTALVGMLNSHLQPKPYTFAQPEAFSTFFREALPLVLLPKYTWENTETLKATVKVANYGKQTLRGPLQYELRGEGVSLRGTLAEAVCPPGGLTTAGTLEIPLNTTNVPTRLDLTVTIDTVCNTYPVWVYPPIKPRCPQTVHEARAFDNQAQAVLAKGGIVYLSPPSTKEALTHSIQAQFSTDFWSVGTFPNQEGGMGQLIDAEHPVFDGFPTEAHTNWQWWPMATKRAVVLPRQIKAIVTEMDSYATLRPMAQLFECRCGAGRLLFSSFGLQDLQQYPEARALLDAIYAYLAGGQFAPAQELPPETIAALLPE